MATIRVAQPSGLIIILSKEKRRVVAIGSILIKELIDRSQELLRLIGGNRALASEVCLKIRHQESGSDSFSGDIGNDQPKPSTTKVQEIVVVSANLAGLDTSAGVFKGSNLRHPLREQSRLDLSCNFEVPSGAALGR